MPAHASMGASHALQCAACLNVFRHLALRISSALLLDRSSLPPDWDLNHVNTQALGPTGCNITGSDHFSCIKTRSRPAGLLYDIQGLAMPGT
jgi:hypothetical protein